MSVGVGEAGLDEIWEARERDGEPGREEMRDMRDVGSEEGEEVMFEDEGGGTGIGDKVTLVRGSAGSEVTISLYLSWSKGDIDKNIGENMGRNNSAGRQVT